MWSLGICLVECALGRYPYPLSTGNFWEIMDQVVSQPAPELPRDVFSPAFLDFIDRWCVRCGCTASWAKLTLAAAV